MMKTEDPVDKEEEEQQELNIDQDNSDNQEDSIRESQQKNKYPSKFSWILAILVIETIILSYLVYQKMSSSPLSDQGIACKINKIEQPNINKQNIQQKKINQDKDTEELSTNLANRQQKSNFLNNVIPYKKEDQQQKSNYFKNTIPFKNYQSDKKQQNRQQKSNSFNRAIPYSNNAIPYNSEENQQKIKQSSNAIFKKREESRQSHYKAISREKNIEGRQQQKINHLDNSIPAHYKIEEDTELTPPLLSNSWQSKTISQQREQLTIDLPEEQLQIVIKQMQFPRNRPRVFKTKKSLAHINDIYFAYTLSKNPRNSQYLQAEYYRLNKRYSIGQVNSQLPMCIVMVGRNIANAFSKLYESIKRQNYTNYHIVHIDDNSNDSSDRLVLEYLNKEENMKLKEKTIFVQQIRNKFALENRDIGISNYCGQSDIVIDIDSDDWLIGNQVLQLVNTLYQTDKDELWLLYLNNIIYAPGCSCPLANTEGEIDHEVLVKKLYRTSNIFRTTHLRTFRKKLYDKIDKNDFRDKFGNYHRAKSDAFIHFALVELAAPEHMKTYDEFVYFYDAPFASPSISRSFGRLASKVITPYQQLQSLQSSPHRIKDYNPPEELYNQFKAVQEQYFGET